MDRFIDPYICKYNGLPFYPYSNDNIKFSVKQSGLFVIAIRVSVYWENVVFSLMVNNAEMFQMSVRGYPYRISEGSMFVVLKLDISDEISIQKLTGDFQDGNLVSCVVEN